MKSMILVALALVAVAAALPVEEHVPQIIRSKSEQDPEGGYIFGYESEDGSKRKETGTVKEALDEENKPHKVVVVRGFYSYPGPDGVPVYVSYSADENGYVAEGDSIPKPVSR